MRDCAFILKDGKRVYECLGKSGHFGPHRMVEVRPWLYGKWLD